MRLPLLFLASLAFVACSSRSEKESPIAAGTYHLENDEDTVMTIDEEGYFSWHVRTCGDWQHDGTGSLEFDPDGSIHVFACADGYPGEGVAWAPSMRAKKIRARTTPTGFEIDVDEVGGTQTRVQKWTTGDACRSTCGCDLPARRPGC
jgi:hypothetical protein